MKLFFGFLIPVLLLSACSQTEPLKRDEPAARPRKPTVAVTIMPQRYLLKRLLGDDFEIMVIVPPGSSPETYAPNPLQMKMLSEADLYVRIGHIGIETAWLEKYISSYPKLKVINPSRSIEFLTGRIHHHSKGDVHETASGDEPVYYSGIDPHIWLSPVLMLRYCRHLAPMLIEKYPVREQQINLNLDRLSSEIEALDQKVRSILTPFKGEGFMVFHPAWGYFARDYGLTQYAIEDEGKSPSPQHMKAMTDLARGKNIRSIFIQNQFERKNAEAIAETLNISVVELDPLQEDWPSMIMEAAQSIASSIKPS